jgi:hypothetical protein
MVGNIIEDGMAEGIISFFELLKKKDEVKPFKLGIGDARVYNTVNNKINKKN